ncbi:helix-turn-helix transcriptional regulator [Streptomyces mesophilus]|uniref:helix-turn-helix transcriptional regulator n=1 Tax=Streptomyces mesophilus TaxID=1775132 RepID=UPI003318D421
MEGDQSAGYPGRVPFGVTPFVGRGTDIAAVLELARASRLVTLTGPGGIGKSRLATQAALHMAEEFTDGACMADLSPLTESALLADSIAASLGLHDGNARSSADAIADHLRDRNVLLILDTCEHVVDECAVLVERLLSQAPRLHILATSRQALAVRGEHLFDVPPMAPDDALDLFARRAAAAVADFTVDDTNRDLLNQLCGRLDGLPLALELAAVRLRALSLGDLHARVLRRFDILDAQRYGAVPRQHTLRASIEWSHALCTPDEQALWARLSRFAGPFSIDSAVQVCHDGELTEDRIVSGLIGLVDKSIVQYSGQRSTGLYRLLDTLREFGMELLRERGEEQQISAAHLVYYTHLAETFDRQSLTPGQADRVATLRGQHADIRRAIDHALSHGEPDSAARLIHGLWLYWHITGRLAEGRYWCSLLQDNSPDTPSHQVVARGVAGYLGAVQGHPDSLLETRDALAVADLTDDPLLAGRARLYFQLAACMNGLPDEASKAFKEGSGLLTAARDGNGLHLMRMHDGLRHVLLQDLDGALATSERGLSDLRSEAPGVEGWVHATYYYVQGLVHMMRQDHASGTTACRAALRVERALGDVTGAAHNLELMAWLTGGSGHLTDTAWLLGAADSLWNRMGGRLTGNAALEAVHQRFESAARSRLGDADFMALWHKGAALSMEDAIDRAVSDHHTPSPKRQPLTPREQEVAGLAVSGLSNREIAESLVLSKRTIDVHMEHIFTKLAITSRHDISARLDTT